MFDGFLNVDSSVIILILALIAGFVLIIFGGDYFVDSAIWLARITKIPEMIVGATIVSIGTTLPEVFVSFTAAASNEVALAVGNATGSVVCNTALILGISLAFSPSKVEIKQFIPKIATLFVAVILLLIFSLDGNVSLIESAILGAVFIFFIVYNVVDALKQKKKQGVETLKEESSDNDGKKERPAWLNVLLLVVGAGGIAVGANLLTSSVSGLAEKIGISTAVISLTIVAIGTSLPELVTTLTALKKNYTEISIGNVMGANIINIGLVVGGSGLIAGGLVVLPQDIMSVVVTVAVAIACFTLIALPILVKGKTSRWQGVILISTYALYLTFLVLNVVGVF